MSSNEEYEDDLEHEDEDLNIVITDFAAIQPTSMNRYVEVKMMMMMTTSEKTLKMQCCKDPPKQRLNGKVKLWP